MTNGMYFSILATICCMRIVPKWVAFGMWVVAVVMAAGGWRWL